MEAKQKLEGFLSPGLPSDHLIDPKVKLMAFEWCSWFKITNINQKKITVHLCRKKLLKYFNI